MENVKQYPKGDLVKRFIALLIDEVCCLVLSFIPLIGWIVACVYFLFRDGFEWKFIKYQSLGKKLMGLKVVVLDGDKKEPDLKVSLRRNWILIIPNVLGFIPIIGWVLSIPVSISIWLVEGIKVMTDPRGIRFGDQWANTQVVEEDSEMVGQLPATESIVEKEQQSKSSKTALIVGVVCLVVMFGVTSGVYKIYKMVTGSGFIEEIKAEVKRGDVGDVGDDKDVDVKKGTKMAEKLLENRFGIKTKVGELPKDFPKDIPIYKGAEIEQSIAFGDSATVRLKSSDSLSEVFEYYKEFFKKEKWEIEENKSDDALLLDVIKKNKNIVLQFNEEGNETFIGIMYSSESEE